MSDRNITFFRVWDQKDKPGSPSISLQSLKSRLWPKRFMILQSVRTHELRIDIDPATDQWYLPIMVIMAALSRARKISVRKDNGFTEISRWHAVGAAYSLLQAFLMGWVSVVHARATVASIERSKGITPSHAPEKGILYISTLEPGIGGALSHTTGLINAFRSAGTDLVYLSGQQNVYLGPEIHQISGMQQDRVFLPGETQLFRRQIETIRVAREKASTYDGAIVYHRLTLDGYAGAVIANKLNSYLIIEYNGSEVDIAVKFSNGLKFLAIARRIERACLERADLIVTVSPVLRDQLIVSGHDASKILCHPNGVDTDFFNPARLDTSIRDEIRASLNLSDDAVLGVFIGTFSPWHGTPTIAKALNQLSEKSKIHILFIGDGSEQKTVMEILKSNGGDKRASFIGRIPPKDVPSYMVSADFALSPNVMPNSNEKFFGSPTKLFEYLAMGLPIIASDLDGIRDVVSGTSYTAAERFSKQQKSEQSCGLLVRPGDPEHLAEALKTIENDASWRKAASIRAREAAVSKYTWSHLARAILEHVNA